jgi:O-acetyl-ADP-ribose deacetylase (regulator of RNase III)
MYNEINGDLIKLALEGKFDVIAHGCNCFCTMGAGIAPQMAKAFGCDKYPMEKSSLKGDINKLGCIDWKEYEGFDLKSEYILYVINAYTQYGFGSNHSNGTQTPLDYEALTLCMRKINHVFKGQHIGLPQIGCGLAGGNWFVVKQIIQTELKDCDVTVVIFKK